MNRRWLVILVTGACALGSLGMLSGCGSGEEGDQIAKALGDAPRPADGLHLPDNGGLDFGDLPKPTGVGRRPAAGRFGVIVLAGERAGRRAQAAERELTKEVPLKPEEQKQLTCFLTEKALDGELPHSPAGVADLVGEFLGEDVAEKIPAYTYAKTSQVLLDVAEQVEAEGGISTENALATVCG